MGAATERLRRTRGVLPDRWVRPAAWGLAGTTALIVAAAGIVIVATGATNEIPGIAGVLGAALAWFVVAAFAAVGFVLETRVPENPIGWLFGAIGWFVAVVVLGGAIMTGDSEGVQAWGAWVTSWAGSAVIPLLVLVLLLFPDGRPLGRRWAILLQIAVVWAVLFPIGIALAPGELDETNGLQNPVGVEALNRDLLSIFWLLLPVFVIAAGTSVVIRFRRSEGIERRQLTLLTLGAAVLVLTNLVNFLTYDNTQLQELTSLLVVLAVATFPVLAGVAIMRHRLYDIDVVIRKTVRYTVLAGMILVIALGTLVAVGGSLVGTRPGTIAIAAFTLGVLVWPLRTVATRVADRIVFGGRATPYEALSSFTHRVGTLSPDDVLPEMVEAVGRATGADGASLWVRDGSDLRLAAAWPAGQVVPDGRPDVNAQSIEHQGDELGVLSVSMPQSDPMDASKRALIADLAANAGPVLRNVLLVADLRESRRRIVAAQDERAKALERNIHDGAQQQLVALAVKQRLASSLIGRDDARAAAMLEELQSDTSDALENLRSLARGIYPPLLADQGLAAAIEAHARRSTLPVAVTAGDLGRYGQDVESAVYFTVLEALQNVAKYAEASTVAVVLDGDHGGLTFTVTDDGRGFDPASAPRGSGVQGMTDRIAAVGGSIEIRSHPGEGTTVRGSIPV